MYLKISLQLVMLVVIISACIRPLLAGDTATSIEVRTNINPVNDFLDKEIPDRKSLEGLVENSKQQAQKGIEGKELLRELSINESDLERKVTELDAIKTNDLEGQGINERNKEENRYYNDFDLDYSSSNVAEHKKDVDLIADASSKLLAKLTDGLKALGIDCKTAKGNKEIEPEYAIEIEKEHFQDSVYTQVFCEELRNKYNCNDTVTLKCLNKGGQLKETIISINFLQMPRVWWKEVIDNTSLDHWLEDSFSSYQRSHYWLINEGDPAVQQQIKQYMADRLQIPVQYIVKVQFDNKTVEVFQHWKSEDSKNFTVTYKDGPDRCLEWQESWDERCILQ